MTKLVFVEVTDCYAVHPDDGRACERSFEDHIAEVANTGSTYHWYNIRDDEGDIVDYTSWPENNTSIYEEGNNA